jgi:hypothetical protein
MYELWHGDRLIHRSFCHPGELAYYFAWTENLWGPDGVARFQVRFEGRTEEIMVSR